METTYNKWWYKDQLHKCEELLKNKMYNSNKQKSIIEKNRDIFKKLINTRP